MNSHPNLETAVRTAASGIAADSAGVGSDWALLFEAVTNRLRQTVGEQAAESDDPQAQQLARQVQAGVLDCVAALGQLHTMLVGHLDRGQRLERDVAEAQQALEQARADLARAQASELNACRPSLHDELTTLPNRSLFHEQLADALARREPWRSELTLLYLDLDGFKSINDLHGYAVGDQLLRIVAVRLVRAVRAVDIVGRLGGDEFACLLRGAMSREELSHLACKLLDAVSAPIRLGALQLSLRTSIGVAVCPAHGASAEACFSRRTRRCTAPSGCAAATSSAAPAPRAEAPRRRCGALFSGRGRDAPDRVADVVGHQQRAALVDRDADRAALGVALRAQESRQHVDRRIAAACRRRRARRSPCSR